MTARRERARIAVTLKGGMLDDYATVRRYIEGVNRFAREIADKTPRSFVLPMRLSDTEIVRMAAQPVARATSGRGREGAEAGRRSMLAD